MNTLRFIPLITEERNLPHSPQLIMQEDAEIMWSRSLWCMQSHMWKCKDVHLPMRRQFSRAFSCGLDCLFASEEKNRKEKKASQKDQQLFSPQQKNIHTNSVSFYFCCIALRQHPVFAMKTRCWNVTLLFVEVGISGTQSSIRKCIPSRSTVKCWFKLYVECFVSSIG